MPVCQHRLSFALLLLTCVSSLTTRGQGAEPESEELRRSQASLERFLAERCVTCHSKEENTSGVTLEELQLSGIRKETAANWIRVLTVLRFGQMPPAAEPQPPRHEVVRIADLIQKRLLGAGCELDLDHKLQQPAYANLLGHERLFDGSIKTPAFSPPRLWRLHPQAYASFLESFGRQLKEGGPLSRPFTTGDGKGLPSNYAPLAQADSATLGQLMLNCRQIAVWQTVGFVRKKKDNRTKKHVERRFVNAPQAFAAILASDKEVTDRQAQAAVTAEFRLVLGRDPSAEEMASFSDLLRRAIAIGGKVRGLQTLAMAVLLRPEAIYRMEVGLGKTLPDGRRMLSSYELAYAIAYALTDLPPDQLMLGPPKPRDRRRRPQPPSLLDLAEEGRLQTREDVGDVVRKIWENDDIEKPRILRFFREFFGYHAAESVFKGDRAGRSFATRFLVKDADQLVLHAVKQDRDVLKRLLTTDRFFVQWPGSTEEYERRIQSITKRLNKGRRKNINTKYFVDRAAKGLQPIPQANPTWRQTVRFYNLDERTWSYPTDQPFPMPKGQRVGILTHPAWLVAWSGNFGNDPIRRGKWIREHLLAGSIPDVPITVNAQVPEDPHKTLRQRLQVTRQDYCWKCHRKMEPLGLPFEAYTDFGRHRAREGLGQTRALGRPKQTAPVVATGEIIDSGDPNIDGPVKDAAELMQRLANSPRVQQSFVRHAFRYWLGRNETFSDSQPLIAADRAYREGNGSFKALVISLMTSDSFLLRK